MQSKLNLNQEMVARARESARRVAVDTQDFIDLHTTVTVERAICRLLGIDGVNEVEVPLPNVVVDHLMDKGALSRGVAYYIGNAVAATGMTPQEIAQGINSAEIDLTVIEPRTEREIRSAVMPVAGAAVERIRANEIGRAHV